MSTCSLGGGLAFLLYRPQATLDGDYRLLGLDDRGACPARERVRDEVVPVTLIAQREEAFTALDQARVERATGELQAGIRAAAPSANGSPTESGR